LARIQVKVYRKTYMTERKGSYVCKVYYVYLPKHVAEGLVGKEFSIVMCDGVVLMKPADPLTRAKQHCN